MTRKEKKQNRKKPVVKTSKTPILVDYVKEAVGEKFKDLDNNKSGCFIFGGYPGEVYYCENCYINKGCIKETKWVLLNGRTRRNDGLVENKPPKRSYLRY